MAFRITYAPLCTVNILHSHFLDQGLIPFELLDPSTQKKLLRYFDIQRFFHISPSPETRELMARFRVKIKLSSTGFSFLVESEEVGSTQYRPKIEFPDTLKFSFGLYPKDENFFNYTNLRVNQSPLYPYYFSNLSQNNTGGKSWLHKAIPAFDGSESYQAGDLITDNVGGFPRLLEATYNLGNKPFDQSEWRIWPAELYDTNSDYPKGSVVIRNNILYRALTKHLSTDSDPPSASWQAFAGNPNTLPNQYVSFTDALPFPLSPKKFSLDITSQAANKLRVKLRRNETYDLGSGPFLLNEVIQTEDGENYSILNLDFSPYPAGKYHLTIKKVGSGGTTFFNKKLYLSDDFTKPNPFGIIEIFHVKAGFGTNWNDFRLLEANGNLKSPTFHTRFRHRNTFWKYIFTNPQTPADFDQLDEILVPNDQTQFETRKVFPITQGYEEIRKLNGSGTTDLLPNPGTQFIQLIDDKIYSEIFINA